MSAEKIDVAKVSGDIFRKGTLVRVAFHKWGEKVAIDADDVNGTEADSKWLGARKRLIAEGETGEVGKIFRSVRKFVKARSLPWSMNMSGVYLVPHGAIADVVGFLRAKRGEVKTEAEKLQDKFLGLREQARESLGPLFREHEYPEDIRAAYGIEWSLWTIAMPDESLASVDRELYEQQRAETARLLTEAKDFAISALREEFLGLVRGAVEKLAGQGTDGPKAVRSTVITKFLEFAETFQTRDVFDDSELRSVVDQAKAAIEGKNVQDINSDGGLRAKIAAEFSAVEATISAAIEKAGRRIDVDDDPEPMRPAVDALAIAAT